MRPEVLIGAGIAVMFVFIIGLPGILFTAALVCGAVVYNNYRTTRVETRIENA